MTNQVETLLAFPVRGVVGETPTLDVPLFPAIGSGKLNNTRLSSIFSRPPGSGELDASNPRGSAPFEPVPPYSSRAYDCSRDLHWLYAYHHQAQLQSSISRCPDGYDS
jgi:hypothetical protein